jgi:ribosomal protein S11
MTGKPVKVVYDYATDTETIIELTDAEIAQIEVDRAAYLAADEAAADAAAALAALKASAKAKLIAGQPLTAEEADTLVL